MKKFIIGLVGLAAVAATPANAATTVFANDFETGFVDPEGTFAPAGEVAIASGQAYNNIGFAGSGSALTNRFATFSSGNVPGSGTLLSATIATIANTLYTINFQFGAIGAPGSMSQRLTFTATDASGDRVSEVFTPTATNNLNSVFNPFQVSFLGDGSALALNFVGEGMGGDNADVLLDNVLVREGAVPETSTWAMMILGLGTVGGVMRRFRRSPRGAVSHA